MYYTHHIFLNLENSCSSLNTILSFKQNTLPKLELEAEETYYLKPHTNVLFSFLNLLTKKERIIAFVFYKETLPHGWQLATEWTNMSWY